MKIKELNSGLFVVNDYGVRLGLLSKALSYYCGILYYRIDWLKEDVIEAVNKAFQRKLLHEIVLLVLGLDEEHVEDSVWTYIKLPLSGMLTSYELHAIESELKEMIAEIVGSISDDELLVYETFITSADVEESETLAEIRMEIEKLDKKFAPMFS